MKKMKKIFAMLIAMVMVLGMSMSVFASTITINPGTPTGGSGTPTYNYYVMLKASVDGDKVAYYVENEALANALDELTVGENDLFTVTKASGATRWNVTINKKGEAEFTGEEVAAALDTIKANAIQKKENSSELTFKLSDDGGEYDGYVLVESSLGTKLVLDTITAKTINEKNTYPSVSKTEDVANAEIGGVVTYTVPVVIPETVAEKDIVVYDTITKGLTLNTAITADQGVTGLTFTQDGAAAADGSITYKVTIPAATVKANAGKTITLTYTATVNEKAVVKEPEKNTAKLVYDNFTSVETEPVEVTTFGFDLLKIGDGDDKNPLANVEFTLTNADGNYYDATVDSNPRFSAGEKTAKTDTEGKIAFAGLAEGTYTLTETKTNDGYNLLAGSITVTIDNEGNATFSGEGASVLEGNTVKINNQAGSVLPSTGGMGTTIFYALGAVLVIGAGVVLVTRRRNAQ